jgi:hypothetical protein
LARHVRLCSKASQRERIRWIFAINGFAYLIISFTGLLLPRYYSMVFDRSFPALLGELAFMLWLVIKGAKPPTLDAASSPVVAD